MGEAYEIMVKTKSALKTVNNDRPMCKEVFLVKVEIISNNIVLVKNENIPRTFRALACIINVHVGNDGIVRLCKIKLGNNILVQPCNRFCRLEEAD